MTEWLLGVDEAGRGPLAGPVAVGVVAVPGGFDVLAEFPGVRDSKQLSELGREKLFSMLVGRKKRGDVRFTVRFSDHLYIDEFGITRAVRRAVWSGVRYLAREPESTTILLDGLLKAPPAYAQQTIVHGDDLVPLISLASVAAKVERDRLMRRQSKQYPEYGFDVHKGYPTKRHYEALRAYGLCAIHRKTYLSRLVPSQGGL